MLGNNCLSQPPGRNGWGEERQIVVHHICFSWWCWKWLVLQLVLKKKENIKICSKFIYEICYIVYTVIYSLYAYWNLGSSSHSDHLLLWVVSNMLGTKLHNSALEKSRKKKPFYFFIYNSLYISGKPDGMWASEFYRAGMIFMFCTCKLVRFNPWL